MSVNKQQLLEALKTTSAEIEVEMLQSFIEVESGGKGFDSKTGKILIQFEPVWYKKKSPYSPSGLWSVNKVDVQSKEWEAFNDAFKSNPEVAMESTSIGLPQIMGFHWKALGYASVGAMWDEFKKGEIQQVSGLIKFITVDPRLLKAMKEKQFDKIASIYNGSGYKDLAIKLGRVPYDVSLQQAYNKYKGLI